MKWTIGVKWSEKWRVRRRSRMRGDGSVFGKSRAVGRPPNFTPFCPAVSCWIALLLAITAPGWADEASTSRAFDAARLNGPSLIAFLKAMPKGADLHNHVSGAIYAETWVDNAIRHNLYFDPATYTFHGDMAPGYVPASKLLQDSHLLSQSLEALSMRGYYPGNDAGHDHFFETFGKMDGASEGLTDEDLLFEVVQRGLSQDEQYMELMAHVAPGSAYASLNHDLPPVDDPAKALQALQPRLNAFVAASRPYLDQLDKDLARRLGLPHPVSSPDSPITVRYIVSANRLAPDSQFFATLAAGMAAMQADPRVVGVNIVAPEDAPFARTHFASQMRLLDFLWRHYGHPKITLHAGELTPIISPLEPMRSRIRDSIEMGHALRIGHGVSIAWEDNLPQLLHEMRQRGVMVEICLTSNANILGVSGDDHPFNLYRRAGVPVNLNTDDEGVNRSNLTLEYARAVRSYNLSYADLKTLSRNSIEYSFLPGDSLYVGHNYNRMRPEFLHVRDAQWTPSPTARQWLARSPKLDVQVRLERAYTAFENGVLPP